jgi:hypothetical protein
MTLLSSENLKNKMLLDRCTTNLQNAEKVGNLKKKKNVKEPMKTKMRALELSQIRRRIELCMREIILF